MWMGRGTVDSHSNQTFKSIHINNDNGVALFSLQGLQFCSFTNENGLNNRTANINNKNSLIDLWAKFIAY